MSAGAVPVEQRYRVELRIAPIVGPLYWKAIDGTEGTRSEAEFHRAGYVSRGFTARVVEVAA